jgi:filamentous hemagglutinin
MWLNQQAAAGYADLTSMAQMAPTSNGGLALQVDGVVQVFAGVAQEMRVGNMENIASTTASELSGAGTSTPWGTAGYSRNTSRLVLNQRLVSGIGEVACGPTSCGMILADNGIPFNIADLASEANIGVKGTDVFGLTRALQNNGLSAARWQSGLTMDNIAEATAKGNAAIVQVDVAGGGSHFVVVDGITTRPGLAPGKLVAVRDPWNGVQYFSPVDEFSGKMTKGNWGILTNPLKH